MTASQEPPPEQPVKRNWIELINESVHTSDDQDIGDIDAVSRDFIVVKRGFVMYTTTIFLQVKLKDGMVRYYGSKLTKVK